MAMWDAPLSPNGVLQYTLILDQTDLARPTSVLPKLANITAQTDFSFSLTLSPYHLYTVTVTPFTRAGKGEAGMDSLQSDESSTLDNYVILWGIYCDTSLILFLVFRKSKMVSQRGLHHAVDTLG